MKNFWAIFFVLIIFFTGCSNEEPVEVKTEKILSPNATLTLTHDGKISLSHELMIYSNVSGKVIEKYFKDGDEVTEGQKLFRIGSSDTESELLQTKAALSEAMTTLAKEMTQKNSVEELQARIAELQERIKNLEDESASGMIYAPITGQLGVDCVRLSEEVLANETILAKIGRTNPAVVSFEISTEEKQLLMASEPKISLKFNDGTTYSRAGKINFLNDETAEVTFDNPNEILLLGNDVQIEIADVKISNTLLVPESAIQKRDGENFVFVDEDKKAALKKILLGGKVGNQFIVKDGLKAGDLIVVEGLTNLREGTPLKIRE